MPLKNSEMNELYPLKFHPQFVEKLWGGRKLQGFLGKDLPKSGKFGESWEISEVDGFVSVVKDGALRNKNLTEIIGIYNEALLGSKVVSKYKEKFPLLIKFLDAQEDLSIQVHPDDKLAKAKGQEYGKSEMWYILHSDDRASLFKGFLEKTDQKTFIESVRKNTIEKLLNSVDVNVDDILHIPAGTIHNIGKGILLAEIQQNSDATYRVYDFDRKDKNGKKRSLHLKEASEALNYQAIDQSKRNFEREINKKVVLLKSEHFITSRYTIQGKFKIEYPKQDSFRIYICISGKGYLSGDFERVEVKMGDTLLIPASINSVLIETDTGFELLECQIP